MGERADFYAGRGPGAEWLGSIAWSGSPDSIREAGSEALLSAKSEEEYRAAVRVLIATREDGTSPSQGWPWPWEDSTLSDYAYAWDDGRVWACHYGRRWRDASLPECAPPWDDCPHNARAHFPEAADSPYRTTQWVGRAKPELGDAVALLVNGTRVHVTGGGSRGSTSSPHEHDAKPAYWWLSKKGGGYVCAARVTNKGHRLLPNVQAVFPPNAKRGEIVTKPGALLLEPRRKPNQCVFPNMKAERNLTFGARSGIVGIMKGRGILSSSEMDALPIEPKPAASR